MRCIWIALVLCSALMGVATASGLPTDAEPHWASEALTAAAEQGILQGIDGQTLTPNAAITGAQAVTILDRVLGAEIPAAEPGVPWYAPAEQAAQELGILPTESNWDLTQPLCRAQAFWLLSNAVQLRTTRTDCLRAYSDCASLQPALSWAAAGLVQAGVVEGNEGLLRPQEEITRAEFVTILYRLMGFDSETATPLLAVQTGQTVRENDRSLEHGLLLTGSVRTVSLQNLDVAGPVILNSTQLASSRIYKVEAPLLVLAQKTGTVHLSNGQFEKVQIGYGTGEVDLTGDLTPELELFSDGREIQLQQMKLDCLVIAGSGNTISLNRQCEVDQILVLEGAEDNKLQINGTAQEITVCGDRTALIGTGRAQCIKIAAAEVHTTLAAEKTELDTGLAGVYVELEASDVAPGGLLTGTATLHGVQMEKVCRAQWYLDGQPIAEFGNPAFVLREGETSACKVALEFTPEMALQHELSFTLEYENPVRRTVETVTDRVQIQVENYPETYYRELERARWETLAEQVSPDYTGDFTMNYDIDYTTEMKEAFVNYNGYESKTEYLLWVNRATQKVNIFTGTQEEWTLLATYRCATGATYTPTPLGVTYVTYKQPAWYMGSYNVYWITRFYPNTGYAFHSRGYYPNSDVAMMPEIGYPMSAGCIRLYDDAASWIYENIPLNTTVVIY